MQMTELTPARRKFARVAFGGVPDAATLGAGTGGTGRDE